MRKPCLGLLSDSIQEPSRLKARETRGLVLMSWGHVIGSVVSLFPSTFKLARWLGG